MLNGVQLEITQSAETLAPQASRYVTAMAMAQSVVHDAILAGDALSHAATPNGSAKRDGAGDMAGSGSSGNGGNGAHYTPG